MINISNQVAPFFVILDSLIKQFMRKSIVLISALILCGSLASPGQVLNKLKQKANNTLNKELDKALGGKNNNQGNSGNTGNQGSSNNGSNNPSNNSGGGLISTPPDVNQNLLDAEAAYKKGTYGESRYAVQQAMLGVEMEIGNQILKSLPQTISGLPKVEQEDRVTSTGFGWAGLTIQRKYNDNSDKQLTVTIANNSAWMSALNLYFSAGGYAQTSGGQQNWKQTKVKGYRAIIEFDQSSGYKLSVPMGQSSLIVYEGINFASEPDMMKAAESIDIDGVKKMLGEQ